MHPQNKQQNNNNYGLKLKKRKENEESFVARLEIQETQCNISLTKG